MGFLGGLTGGDILTGAGLAASVLGGSKNKGASTEVKSVLDSMPPELRNAYLNVLLPNSLANFTRPFTSIPMERVSYSPSSKYGPQTLGRLQEYSDNVGGYFSPIPGLTNTAPAFSAVNNAATLPAGLRKDGDLVTQGDIYSKLFGLEPSQLKFATDPGVVTKILTGKK